MSLMHGWLNLWMQNPQIQRVDFILNKMSLDRNTHKQPLCIDQLVKVLTRGSQEPNLVFPLGAMIQYSLIQYSW